VRIPIPKKATAVECVDYRTRSLISRIKYLTEECK